ncbi:hypothetical protein HDU84_007238 [Entophlyctis sp. JEL0112]|nr:hypothetical protein HDU84_007238 [Entophlyctis sp. JEL0112]
MIAARAKSRNLALFFVDAGIETPCNDSTPEDWLVSVQTGCRIAARYALTDKHNIDVDQFWEGLQTQVPESVQGHTLLQPLFELESARFEAAKSMANVKRLEFLPHQQCNHKNVRDENFKTVCTFFHCVGLLDHGEIDETFLDNFKVAMYDVPLIQEFFVDTLGTSIEQIDFAAAMKSLWLDINPHHQDVTDFLAVRLIESIAWELIMQKPSNTVFEDQCQTYVSNILLQNPYSTTAKTYAFRAYFLLRESVKVTRMFKRRPEWQAVCEARSVEDAIEALRSAEGNADIVSELQRISTWFTLNPRAGVEPDVKNANAENSNEETEALNQRIAQLQYDIEVSRRRLQQAVESFSDDSAISAAVAERDTIFDSFLSKVGVDFKTLATIEDVQAIHDFALKGLERYVVRLPVEYVEVLQNCEILGRNIVRKRIDAVNLLCTDATDPSSYVAAMVAILAQQGVRKQVEDICANMKNGEIPSSMQLLSSADKVLLTSSESQQKLANLCDDVIGSIGENERNAFIDVMGSFVRAGSLMELMMHETLAWIWTFDEQDGFDPVLCPNFEGVVLFPSLVERDAGEQGVLRRLRKGLVGN